ncbi:MAG: redoxin domain-containing protein [Nitrososphaerales archaeon]
MNQNGTYEKRGPNARKESERRPNASPLRIGEVVSPRELATIHGDTVRVPDPEHVVHLQFRRFAGCPVCAVHLRSIAMRHPELVAAGIREVVVFHSAAKKMLEFHDLLPFAAIADPEKTLYAEFGADRNLKMSPTAIINPRTYLVAVNTLVRGSKLNVNWTGKGEVRDGAPSEFLIGTDGRLMAVKYGNRIDDHWSVDEILELGKSGPRRMS